MCKLFHTNFSVNSITIATKIIWLPSNIIYISVYKNTVPSMLQTKLINNQSHSWHAYQLCLEIIIKRNLGYFPVLWNNVSSCVWFSYSPFHWYTLSCAGDF
jgi:hypothetical protein